MIFCRRQAFIYAKDSLTERVLEGRDDVLAEPGRWRKVEVRDAEALSLSKWITQMSDLQQLAGKSSASHLHVRMLLDALGEVLVVRQQVRVWKAIQRQRD